jgi:hypothetical protein
LRSFRSGNVAPFARRRNDNEMNGMSDVHSEVKGEVKCELVRHIKTHKTFYIYNFTHERLHPSSYARSLRKSSKLRIELISYLISFSARLIILAEHWSFAFACRVRVLKHIKYLHIRRNLFQLYHVYGCIVSSQHDINLELSSPKCRYAWNVWVGKWTWERVAKQFLLSTRTTSQSTTHLVDAIRCCFWWISERTFVQLIKFHSPCCFSTHHPALNFFIFRHHLAAASL